MEHASFQIYRTYPAGVIWKNRQLTIDGKYINKEVLIFHTSNDTCASYCDGIATKVMLDIKNVKNVIYL